jgi:hypothetical protein
MLKATLTFVDRNQPLVLPTSLAELEDEDIDFLARHVDKLRESAITEQTLLSRFQHGSGIPAQLQELLAAGDADFIEISRGLADRLYTSMRQSTTPGPGVLALIVNNAGQGSVVTSVLKLDAINEAASYRVDQGAVKLSVLRNLLPAPGQLQKGISWPDPRVGSDAIVIDRNQSAARYFFNAYELRVSATSAEAERVLGTAIVKGLPKTERAQAMEFVVALSGPADKVVAQLKSRYPDLDVDQPELGGGDTVGGYIRAGKVARHMTRYRGDGILVVVPNDRLDRVEGPTPVGGGWELTVRFSARPEEDAS